MIESSSVNWNSGNTNMSYLRENFPRLFTSKRGPKGEAGTEQKQLFAELILKLSKQIDFPVSTRGFCYLLEEYGLTKRQFKTGEELINDLWKKGLLPVDICSEDQDATIDNLERKLDPDDVEKFAQSIMDRIPDYVMSLIENYHPISFWDYQDYFIIMAVEQKDLKGLFLPVCEQYHIPLVNNCGWSDINTRIKFKRLFKKMYEEQGKKSVILSCGDRQPRQPRGLTISKTIRSNYEEIACIEFDMDNLIIERFSLTDEFLEAHCLLKKPTLARELCEGAILKYINTDGLRRYVEALEIYRSQALEAYNRLLYYQQLPSFLNW
jgi:hypothetical protein